MCASNMPLASAASTCGIAFFSVARNAYSAMHTLFTLPFKVRSTFASTLGDSKYQMQCANTATSHFFPPYRATKSSGEVPCQVTLSPTSLTLQEVALCLREGLRRAVVR